MKDVNRPDPKDAGKYMKLVNYQVEEGFANNPFFNGDQQEATRRKFIDEAYNRSDADKKAGDIVIHSGLSYSDALYYARSRGLRIQRAGWNGKGMWVCVGGESRMLAADDFWNCHARKFAMSIGGSAEVLPYMLMKTADGKILMGWLASQTDMLTDDWQVLDYAELEGIV